MRVMSEEVSAELIDEELALSAARQAFLASRYGKTFPVVVAHTTDGQNRLTVKSGSTPTSVGVKIGSYWPGNPALGLARHSSTVLLLDPDTGRVAAVVEASHANGYRTAAADALAVETLSRAESRVLTVVGTGSQARHEALAVSRVRPIENILVVGRRADAAARAAADLRRLTGISVAVVGAEEGCRRADIIVTATTATAPVLDVSWVRAGTHISAMGADGPGKQELPTTLLGRARLFCDLPDQARRIGEFQHAAADATITALGDVLHGIASGRTDDEQITIFDSSGFALQDLALAAALLAREDALGSRAVR
ncbi:ornithine cyclodeaminase family protein [uncultured Friedmanniella sp.]|uniref:ornithine cyclodeaminase family protein n=1 Tax=uncultured Friedmanniella sp. TaxID=335381 RepID=UPI0035C9723D